MKKFLLYILLVLFAVEVAGQSYSFGIDLHRDSVSMVAFRRHMDSIRKERPTVALVLSGGGAKGAAHIPVIQYLEKAHIPIDLVMGTSIGGLVGGLYACGYTGDELEFIMKSQDWDYLLRDTHPRRYDALKQKDYDRQHQLSIAYGTYKWDFHKPEISKRSIIRDGIVQGRNIENLFASLLVGYEEDRDFLSLPTPFVCIATDMITAKPKIWHCGGLKDALRSTMSIPGLFTPVKVNGMVLMDGSMRNNYPAALAHQMGADIVIGVDISSPSLEAGQMNSMLDIVYQTTDVLGREAYVASLEATDIYIQPDLTGFSLLSFDQESIDTMMQRGRTAVESHSAEIKELHDMLERAQTPLISSRNPHDNKATNMMGQSVQIKEITFDGINSKEERFLRKKLGLTAPGTVTVHILELEDIIATLMGTKAFEKVTYEILGDQAPYTLKFNCYRAPVNQLGASVRFDSKDYASILLNTGINTHQLTGGCLDFSARLGLNTVLTAATALRTGRGVDWNMSLSFQAARNGEFRKDDNDYRIDFNRGRGDLYLTFSPWKRLNMDMGFRADYFYRTSLLADIGTAGNEFTSLPKSNIFIGPFFQIRSDSFDDPYFPTKGEQHHVKYSWIAKSLLSETKQVHTMQIGFRSAHSAGRVSFIPFLEGRYVSATVTPYVNMLSISDANKILDQQITFNGINTTVWAMRTVGTVGLSLRTRIGKKNYITAQAQVLHQSDRLQEFIDGDLSLTNYGFSLEYAYSSIVGPIKVNVHWSDLSETVGFYLGVGLEF